MRICLNEATSNEDYAVVQCEVYAKQNIYAS